MNQPLLTRSDWRHTAGVALSLVALCVAAVPIPAETLAIRAGTLHTMAGDRLQNAVVLIEAGKIRAVGADVQIPEGATVIDASKLTAMPGMIDALSRLYLDDQELNEGREIAAELSVLDGADPFIEEWKQVVAEGVTAVCVAPGSRSTIGGVAAVLKVKGARNPTDLLVKEQVSVKASIGMSFDNTSSSLTRLSHYASVREALIAARKYARDWRRYDDDFADYEKRKAEIAELKKAGKPTDKVKEKPRPKRPGRNPTSEALGKVLGGELPLQVEAHRADDILNALRLADEFGIKLILDHCTEGYKVADEIAKRKVPVLVGPISPWIGNPWLEYRNHTVGNCAALAAERIKIAIGVAGPGGLASKLLPLQAAMAVAGGLDEEAALRAVTIHAAQIFGVADRIGSIEAGKDADIVILDGEPLDARARVERVLVDGETVYVREQSQ